MLPKLHPLSKTAIEARRSIQRLQNFLETNAEDEHVKNGIVQMIIEDLKNVRLHIPKELKDTDLQS